MTLPSLDSYLLEGTPPKGSVVATILADPPQAPAAAPFVRALRAVGDRAPDEALIALRLAAAGCSVADNDVRRLRAFAALSRASGKNDSGAIDAAFARDPDALAAFRGLRTDPPALAHSVRRAYSAELEPKTGTR